MIIGSSSAHGGCPLQFMCGAFKKRICSHVILLGLLKREPQNDHTGFPDVLLWSATSVMDIMTLTRVKFLESNCPTVPIYFMPTYLYADPSAPTCSTHQFISFRLFMYKNWLISHLSGRLAEMAKIRRVPKTSSAFCQNFANIALI